MPTFEIPDGPTAVELKREGDPKKPAPVTGSAVYSVTNKSSVSCQGRLSVQVAGSTKAEWFTIDGERERSFNPGQTQTASVKITIPPEVLPGDYPFRLRVVAVNDPDNDHADGAVTVVKLTGPVKPASKWWIWVLVALVVLAVIGGIVWYLLTPHGNVPNFVGETVDQAQKNSSGYQVNPVAGTASGKAPQIILSQDPQAGTSAKAGTAVKVTFDPGVTVPDLVGQGAMLSDAVNQITNKLHVRQVISQCQDSGIANQVVGQSLQAQSVVAKNSDIDLTIRTLGTQFGNFRWPCGRSLPWEKVMKTKMIRFNQ